MKTFAKRRIKVIFQLGTGDFGDGGYDTFEASGLRVACNVEQTGGIGMTQCSLKVFGLPLKEMNRLTILGKPLVDNRNNTVTVFAGDEGPTDDPDANLAVVFTGTISEAWVDGKSMPQVPLVVSAFSGGLAALEPVAPVSFRGSIDAALIVASIAAQLSYNLENSGVSVILTDPYLPGTPLQQLQKVARAGNFNCIIDGETIAIWPADGVRGGQQPLLSPETGLIGYPLRTDNGIEVQTLFNPNLSVGSTVEVRSAITPANGIWQLFKVAHDLESETPNGKWFTTGEASLFGQAVPVA